MRGHGGLFVEKEDGKRLSLVPVGTVRTVVHVRARRQLLSLNLSPNGETNMPRL